MANHDSASALMRPDVVLPEQFFGAPNSPPMSPERRLMLAVLEEAVLTLLRHRRQPARRPRRAARDAAHWIEQSDPSWPFSFESICAALQLDADYVRQGLRAITESAGGADAARSSLFPFARRVAGRRHKVGLLLPHRKASGASS